MENNVVTQQVNQKLPYVIERVGQSKQHFIDEYRNNEEFYNTLLLEKGALLFKGLDISSLAEFEFVISSISSRFMSYVDGFSPRKKLSENVYTSTEYDADFHITLHNELSYSNIWPSKLFFFCLTPAQWGGETPIADGHEVLDLIPPDLLEEFERKGVKYVRNLHGGNGVGPSWQQTYETQSREFVEQFCASNHIEFIWKSDGGLRLIQKKPAVILHPQTGKRVWFNQVDQFHPCHFNKDIYETLMTLYNHDEMSLPMYGCFGDDSPIADDKIHTIRRIMDQSACPVAWEKGDLLLVDNVAVSHGRMPYKGFRKILVSMSA